MDLKTLFIQIDNLLQDNEKTVFDCQSILSNYNSLDYLHFITKEEIDKLHDEKIDYIKISIPSMNNYLPHFFDPYLLVWSNNKFSKIHDHPEKGCVLKVLKGSIKEIRYSNPNLQKISENIVNEGETSYIHNNQGFHKVKNNDKTKMSISLHIYSPKDFIINYF